ncbi:MAG: phosphoribosylanthranilate isomerase [Deltaproteobacteria bacterium]|jgi:phosphoribosylanthranilate isomerase|nr:phosphoribosylanthranilate isomerase [Deltaproteobacteria bacterium]
MSEDPKPIIKVCGLARPQDATMAAILGADMCGFIFHPKSPRAVAPNLARAMATPGAKRVGVFVDQSPGEILEIMDEAGLDLAQFHGGQEPATALDLGPDRVIKVFWPERQTAGELAGLMDLWKDLAAYFLFDSGTGGGGSGRPIRVPIPASPKPYLLSGGLTPEMARSLWPPEDPMLVGFDLNSGLEDAPRVKNANALKTLLPWRR